MARCHWPVQHVGAAAGAGTNEAARVAPIRQAICRPARARLSKVELEVIRSRRRQGHRQRRRAANRTRWGQHHLTTAKSIGNHDGPANTPTAAQRAPLPRDRLSRPRCPRPFRPGEAAPHPPPWPVVHPRQVPLAMSRAQRMDEGRSPRHSIRLRTPRPADHLPPHEGHPAKCRTRRAAAAGLPANAGQAVRPSMTRVPERPIRPTAHGCRAGRCRCSTCSSCRAIAARPT